VGARLRVEIAAIPAVTVWLGMVGCTTPPPGSESAAPVAHADAGAGPATPTPTPTADAGAPSMDTAPARKQGELGKTSDPTGARCGLTISDVAVYQAVKTLIVRDGVEVAQPAVDLVQRRPALVRVFVKTTSAWASGEVKASLTISAGGDHKVLTDHAKITAASTDAALESTLNFDLPAEAISDGATYAIALEGPTACAGVRFPAEGTAPLGARRVGTLRVKLVPIKYGTDGSDRLPDTSPAQLERLRAQLQAMYPVEAVELSLRAPVRTTVTVDPGPDGWNSLLDAMRDLRAADNPAADIFYFGLVAPAATVDSYCPGGCYLGLSFRTDRAASKYQAGVGLGYTGDLAATILAHELGHMAGRKHSPCKVSTYLDAEYPQAEGKTASWGWDVRTRSLLSPEATRDLMGYCQPAWISEYTYRGVLGRLSDVTASAGKAASLSVGQPGWRVLLVGETRARWGLPAAPGTEPEGAPETASVLDESGAVIASVPVWRSEVGEGNGWSVQVPEPQPGWAAIQVAGAPAVRFDAAGSVPPLER
jgi:hypothetical protein